MASIDRRQRRNAAGKLVTSYRVRWREPDGQERSRTVAKKIEAARFRDVLAADIVKGQYIDPAAGKISFKTFAAQWLKSQTYDELTYEAVELRLRLHATPHLGNLALNDITPTTIRNWLRQLNELAATYRQVLFANVSTVLTAAVDDELITKNPCKAPSVSRPKVIPKELRPWTRERVVAVRNELPEQFRLVVWLGAGLGLRQGEIFGLSPSDIDFERGEVHVQRQVKVLSNNSLLFSLPKGGKTRRVPLPDVVHEAITAHMTSRPPVDVTLPWATRAGNDVTVPLLLYSREHGALNRNYFNPKIWRPALVRAGVPAIRENGCHALRHFYASVLLHEGETIKALAEYLGHADPGFTLRTYTHLMEGSATRTKRALDAVFGGRTSAPSAHRRTQTRRAHRLKPPHRDHPPWPQSGPSL